MKHKITVNNWMRRNKLVKNSMIAILCILLLLVSVVCVSATLAGKNIVSNQKNSVGTSAGKVGYYVGDNYVYDLGFVKGNNVYLFDGKDVYKIEAKYYEEIDGTQELSFSKDEIKTLQKDIPLSASYVIAGGASTINDPETGFVKKDIEYVYNSNNNLVEGFSAGNTVFMSSVDGEISAKINKDKNTYAVISKSGKYRDLPQEASASTAQIFVQSVKEINALAKAGVPITSDNIKSLQNIKTDSNSPAFVAVGGKNFMLVNSQSYPAASYASYTYSEQYSNNVIVEYTDKNGYFVTSTVSGSAEAPLLASYAWADKERIQSAIGVSVRSDARDASGNIVGTTVATQDQYRYYATVPSASKNTKTNSFVMVDGEKTYLIEGSKVYTAELNSDGKYIKSERNDEPIAGLKWDGQFKSSVDPTTGKPLNGDVEALNKMQDKIAGDFVNRIDAKSASDFQKQNAQRAVILDRLPGVTPKLAKVASDVIGTVNVVSADAQGFSGFSSLFMSREKLAAWRMEVDKSFRPATSEGWVQAICKANFKQPPQQTAFVRLPGSAIKPVATVAAECSKAIDTFGGLPTNMYKLTLYITNPSSTLRETPMKFNIQLFGSQNIDLFTQKMNLSRGQSFALDKSQKIILSNQTYNKICIAFEEPPEFFDSATVCNKIECRNQEATSYDSLPQSIDVIRVQKQTVSSSITSPGSETSTDQVLSLFNPNI